MVPADLIQWGKGVAVFGGVIVGIYAVFSPSYVWHRKQIFGWGSGALCAVGTVLIVASIFHTITVSAPGGIEMQFSELQKEIAATKEMAANTNASLAKLSTTQNAEFVRQLANVQKNLDQLSQQISHVSNTSNAALSGVRSINNKVNAFMPTGQKQDQRSPAINQKQFMQQLPFRNETPPPK